MSATPNATYPLHCVATTDHPLTSTKAAALLLGQELYPLYTHWQIDIEDPEQIAVHPYGLRWDHIIRAVRQEGLGGMPSAETFKAFMNTRWIKEHLYTQYAENSQDEEDSGNGEESPDLLTTRLCKHSVHPGNSCNATEVCPVCLMKHCLASLARIAHVWRLVGGPLKPHGAEDEELVIYYSARRIWYAEKSRWANLVNVYEQFAEEERSWEEDSRQDGYEIPASVGVSSSCMQALELAMHIPFLVEGWDEPFVPKRRTKQRSMRNEAETKTVAREKDNCFSFSPPNSPKLDPEISHYPVGISDRTAEPEKQTENSINAADTMSPISNNPTVPLRSPPTSSQSSNYAPSPSRPPSSPPQNPSHLHLPSPPMFGVHFPDDLPEPSSRAPSYFQRSSPLYGPGNHASPLGSRWADTSFMGDYSYDDFGNNEEEEEEEGIYDWSDYSDSDDEDGDDEDDPTVHPGRETVGGKRLPGEDNGLNIRRPVFFFNWLKHPEPKDKYEAEVEAMVDEFYDAEVEQAMRDMVPETTTPPTDPAANSDIPMVASGGAETGMAALAAPDIQVSPRRRSHDEFKEEEVQEKNHVKKHRH